MRRAFRPTVDAWLLRPIRRGRLVAAFGGRLHILSLAIGCAGTGHDAGSRLKTPAWPVLAETALQSTKSVHLVLAGIALAAMRRGGPEIRFCGLAGSEAEGVTAKEGGVQALVGEDLVAV